MIIIRSPLERRLRAWWRNGNPFVEVLGTGFCVFLVLAVMGLGWLLWWLSVHYPAPLWGVVIIIACLWWASRGDNRV